MSSESERRLSTEELKRLNQPSKAAPSPMVLLREADWEELLDRLDGLEAGVSAQEALLRALSQQVGQLPDIIVHQGDVRGVHGDVAAHAAHGDAHGMWPRFGRH